MDSGSLVLLIYLLVPVVFADDVSYFSEAFNNNRDFKGRRQGQIDPGRQERTIYPVQACVDKYSRKGYQPWQEWSDHYTCHRYRCEIRDGKYFIAAVGCRKPKIPENALECHEYIEDENVEFPTCCARLRCVVEINGDRVVQTRGQPGELFPDKPWKGPQNEPNPAVVGMAGIPQNTISEVQNQANPGMYNRAADGSEVGGGRRFVDPYPVQQMQESPRKKRSTITPLFTTASVRDIYQAYPVKQSFQPERYPYYFPNGFKDIPNQF